MHLQAAHVIVVGMCAQDVRDLLGQQRTLPSALVDFLSVPAHDEKSEDLTLP
jgi:hypothetical protein